MEPNKDIEEVKYLYTLEDTFVYSNEKLKKLSFKSDWLEIKPEGIAIIPKGYPWDGCSPKWRIGNTIFGTPEGPIDPSTGKPSTYYASLVHDALYQFMYEIAKANNISSGKVKKIADNVFLDVLIEKNFKYAQAYYYAVKIFGGLYKRLKRFVKNLWGQNENMVRRRKRSRKP